VGGGELTGPDLEGAAAMEPETLRSEVERMQDYAGPLSEEEIALLVDLLADPEAAARIEQARGAAEAEEDAAAEIEAEGSAETGELLFTGERRLAGGGLPCAACHRAGGGRGTARSRTGGTLAADLTASAERLGGAGLIRAAEQASFPVMRAAYRDHPVTHEEAVHLAAFLSSVGPEGAPAGSTADAGPAGDPPRSPAPAAAFPLAGWGLGVALGCLALVAALYRNREQRGGGVRARLLRRAGRA
jgi:hypothetical protein